MFKDVVFLNEDGTVFNIVNVRSLEAIEDMPEYKDKTWFDVTGLENRPGPQSTYNFETQDWTHSVPEIVSVENLEHLQPISSEIAEDDLAGGNN